MSLVFFYGTLKRGFYNNVRIGLDDPNKATFLGEAVLPDHAMVVDGTLPYAFEHKGSVLRGELYDVHDKSTRERIERMELGAGYEMARVTVIGADTESRHEVDFYRVTDQDFLKSIGRDVSTFYDEDSAKI